MAAALRSGRRGCWRPRRAGAAARPFQEVRAIATLRSTWSKRSWCLILALLLLAAGRLSQATGAEISPRSPLYSALAPAFTAVDPHLTRLEVVERRPAGERYAVLLVRAGTRDEPRDRGVLAPDSSRLGTFGLFLVDARSDALRLTLGVLTTDYGYEVASVRADERSATVGQRGAGFANYWDVVEKVIHAIRRAGDHLYLGASDGLYVLGNETLTHVELVPDLSRRYFVRIAKP